MGLCGSYSFGFFSSSVDLISLAPSKLLHKLYLVEVFIGITYKSLCSDISPEKEEKM